MVCLVSKRAPFRSLFKDVIALHVRGPLTFDHVVQVRNIVLWIVAAQVAFWSGRRSLQLAVAAQTSRSEQATGTGRGRYIARRYQPRLTSLKKRSYVNNMTVGRDIIRFRNSKRFGKDKQMNIRSDLAFTSGRVRGFL